jgi:hypothetical protein
MSGLSALLAVGAVLATAPPPNVFDDGHFAFAFSYDPAWIASISPAGETVTFSLSEGEVYVSAGRDPNPHRLKSRQELAERAEEEIQTWKNRLDFTKIERKESTLNGLAATEVTGTAKLFDNEQPYKLDLYVLEREGRLYVVKYSGLYDASLPYWDGFERMVKTFRFRDPANAPRSTPVPTPYVPLPTPGQPGNRPDSSWSDKGD